MAKVYYNGVLLPELPDREYAKDRIIFRRDTGETVLIMASVYRNYVRGDSMCELSYPTYTYYLSGSSWQYDYMGASRMTVDTSLAESGNLIWTSFDVYTDSYRTNLYYPGREPGFTDVPAVPYEPEEEDKPVTTDTPDSSLRQRIKHFLNGLSLGLCGKPLPFVPGAPWNPEDPAVPGRVPVAYLYNDVRLPPLPEWDKTEYPYAVIEGWKDSYVTISPYIHYKYLLVSKEPLVVHKSSSTSTNLYLYGLKGAKSWSCVSSDGFASWTDLSAYSTDSRICWYGNESKYDQHRFMWANYDVENTDYNSIFCGKSEPVPVYE